MPFSPLCCTLYLLIPSWTNCHLLDTVYLLVIYTVLLPCMQMTLLLLVNRRLTFITCLRSPQIMLYSGVTISTLLSLRYWFLVNLQSQGRETVNSGNGLWVALSSLNVIPSTTSGFSALSLHPLSCALLSAVHLAGVLFFALNAVGSRFGCLHPSTSFRLYSSFCIPLLLYGCELWSPTNSEITMLERVHRKILRTIQGLPLRCHSRALQFLMDVPSILSLTHQRELVFLLLLTTP